MGLIRLMKIGKGNKIKIKTEGSVLGPVFFEHALG